jgi:hypothetical protein
MNQLYARARYPRRYKPYITQYGEGVITRDVQVESVRPFNAEATSYGVKFEQVSVDGVDVPAVVLVTTVPLSDAETMLIGKKYKLTLEEVVE